MDWRSIDVTTGGATLAAQVSAEGDGATVVLLGGATWSRDWWPDELCAALVGAGLRVVRYDPRDTGESTCDPPGEPTYVAADLVGDVVAVLDAVGAERALLVGLSMGAGLAQAVATAHPDRVAGLLLIACTPADAVERDLPPSSPVVMATFEDPLPDPDWSDRDAYVDWCVASERPFAGPDAFDEAAVREAAGRSWDRCASPASSTNHFLVIDASAPVDLAAVRAPAVVAHGSADPLFPLPHGEALAAALDAPLVVLEGAGHQMPPPVTWPDLVDRVVGLA